MGNVPSGIWPKLVPELLVSDLGASLDFWVGLLGFSMKYGRPEDGFASVDLRGAQVMLQERSGDGETGALEKPFGRGVSLQIEVPSVKGSAERLAAAEWPLYEAPRDRWHRSGNREWGQRELLVADPDGYLLRLAEDLGSRLV